jgi:hypothetical protein
MKPSSVGESSLLIKANVLQCWPKSHYISIRSVTWWPLWRDNQRNDLPDSIHFSINGCNKTLKAIAYRQPSLQALLAALLHCLRLSFNDLPCSGELIALGGLLRISQTRNRNEKLKTRKKKKKKLPAGSCWELGAESWELLRERHFNFRF